MTQHDFETIARVFKEALSQQNMQEEEFAITCLIIGMGREFVDTYREFDRDWFSQACGLPADHWIVGYKGADR